MEGIFWIGSEQGRDSEQLLPRQQEAGGHTNRSSKSPDGLTAPSTKRSQLVEFDKT
jgi:hypothetical protein